EHLLDDPQLVETPETAEERFVLAQLYMALGNSSKVTNHMRTLLATHDKERRFVDAYVKYLLSRGEADEAELWMKRLEEGSENARPQDPLTKLSFSLETMFLREQYGEMLSAVEAFVNEAGIDDDQRRIRTRRVGALLELYAERIRKAGQGSAQSAAQTNA